MTSVRITPIARRLGGHRSQRRDTIDVYGPRQPVILLVGSPEATARVAQAASMAAGHRGNTDGIEALLLASESQQQSTSPSGDHPQPRRETNMVTTKPIYVSLYDQRVQLVAHALEQNSKLGETEAVKLAVHVLYAIDHIPEKVR
jgi:hypothetical protein